MDPITHALVGIVASEATVGRRIGRAALWLGAVAGAAPDIDVLVDRLTGNPWMSLFYHRGPTHGLPVVPLVAGVVAGGFWLFRRRQFAPMFLLALIAVMLHSLLDVVTSYGTQVLWPISTRRFAYDYLPIVDIYFTPVLLLTVLGCWAAGRWGRSPGRARTVAWVGLALAGVYVLVGVWADFRSQMVVPKAIRGEVRAIPQLGTVFARRVISCRAEGFYVARYNVLRTRGQPDWHFVPTATGPAVEPADQICQIQLFRWFAMGQARAAVERATDRDGREVVRVTYHDMRYGYPADATDSIFWAWVILDARTNEVLAGPANSHWSRRAEPPTGVAAAFPPPPNHLDISHDRWARIRAMWRDAWRE